MTRTEPLDVGDGVVERVDHPHRQLQVEELGRVVEVGRDTGARDACAGPFVADELDLGEGRVDPGQERVGHRRVHEQALGGVAHRRPLGLGVDDDVERHVEIGSGIDIHVTVPLAVDHIGNGGIFEDRPDE